MGNDPASCWIITGMWFCLVLYQCHYCLLLTHRCWMYC